MTIQSICSLFSTFIFFEIHSFGFCNLLVASYSILNIFLQQLSTWFSKAQKYHFQSKKPIILKKVNIFFFLENLSLSYQGGFFLPYEKYSYKIINLSVNRTLAASVRENSAAITLLAFVLKKFKRVKNQRTFKKIKRNCENMLSFRHLNKIMYTLQHLIDICTK